MSARPVLLKVVLFGLMLLGAEVLAATNKDSNSYIEKVISTYILPETKSIDPVTLPPFNTSFPDTFLRIKVNVKVRYTNGRLNGLSTVLNLENCTKPDENFGNYTIECYLGFKDLEMNYDAKLKYGRVPNVNIQASAKVKGTTLLVEVTTNPTKNVPYLRRFDVRDVGVITPKYTGVGPLNRYLSMLTNTFLRTATSEFMQVLNREFKDVIAKSVSKAAMPTV